MTKEELIKLAIDSQGTNFGYEDMREEDLRNDKMYQAKMKIAMLSPEEQNFINEYQLRHKPNNLKAIFSLFKTVIYGGNSKW